MRLAGERLKCEQATAADSAAGVGGTVGAFLGQCVPLTTGLAFALPTGEGGAAVLANEGKIAPRHGENNHQINSLYSNLDIRTIQEQNFRQAKSEGKCG